MAGRNLAASKELPLGADPTESDWGSWMTGWRSLEDADEEQERVDRQKAAFGAETLRKLKDINVLIVGCRGVGVEAAKDLILSNVGAVMIWDGFGPGGEPAKAAMPDMGTNFYLSEKDVVEGKGRLEACLPQLRSLNPYCKVEAADSKVLSDEFLTQKDVLKTRLPFSAVIITQLLPRAELERINETCRANKIAFLLAHTAGATSSLFSDFGPKHIITDQDGEPSQTLAIKFGMEVMPLPYCIKVDGKQRGDLVAIISTSENHTLDTGDKVKLEDMSGSPTLDKMNGKEFKVARVSILCPRGAVPTETDAYQKWYENIHKLAADNKTEKLTPAWESQLRHFNSEEREKTGKDDARCPVREVTLLNRFVLLLDDLSEATQAEFAAHTGGGLFTSVKKPLEVEYRSFAETLEKTVTPHMMFSEAAESGIDVHLALDATLKFRDEAGDWPRLHNAEDADKVAEIAQNLSDSRKEVEGACFAQKINWGFPSGEARDVDAKFVKRFARLFHAELTGFCAFLGGAVAQEVIKTTGKFTPIDQWVHHDDPMLVVDQSPTNVAPVFGTRYDYQIAVMGKHFQDTVANQNIFLVGCGALGCEYLKGIALMGACTNGGKCLVTDMDTIEVSNLSRQFLFRRDDVGKPKSESGAACVRKWNPELNVEPVLKRVGPGSENFFSDSFWTNLDVTWAALDNVEARKYIDKRCLWYGKPLLESGTLGTASNSEVILPYRTQSYNDGKETDEAEKKIAMCTLRNFPYLPVHCIEFAKAKLWNDNFEFGPEQYEAFRKDKASFFERLDTMNGEERAAAVLQTKAYTDVQRDGTPTFETCVRFAFEQLIKEFRTNILDVQHTGDSSEKESGEPYWTGTKRRPNAAEWPPKNGDHPGAMEYLYAASNLYAHIFGIEEVRHRQEFADLALGLNLEAPAWQPSGKKLAEEEDDDEAPVVSEAELSEYETQLMSADVGKLMELHPHDFEKDDDMNFHIDYLTAASNLRAWNYNIALSDRHWVKVTAGNIIPALATTTAMVCGLNCIEFCKLVMGLHNSGTDAFFHSNVNLATGKDNFTVFSPVEPISIDTHLDSLPSFTSWDKMELRASTTKELVENIERRFPVKVNSLQLVGRESKPFFSELDMRRLHWDISWSEGYGKGLKYSPECVEMWPELKSPMTRTMLTRGEAAIAKGDKPPPSYDMTVKKIDRMIASLTDIKGRVAAQFDGPIREVFSSTYAPQEDDFDSAEEYEEAKAYFDELWGSRNYLPVTGSFKPLESSAKGEAADGASDDDDDEEDDTWIELPPIRVLIGSAMKRSAGDEGAAEGEPDTKRARTDTD